jgi:hypothetical protein
MAKIKESFVECGHCGAVFRCPFFIGDTKTFAHAVLWGNRVKCRCCEVTFDCQAGNMSYVLDDESELQPSVGSAVSERPVLRRMLCQPIK